MTAFLLSTLRLSPAAGRGLTLLTECFRCQTCADRPEPFGKGLQTLSRRRFLPLSFLRKVSMDPCFRGDDGWARGNDGGEGHAGRIGMKTSPCKRRATS